MKYLTGLSIILGLTLFSSCIKHEVIPAPTPRVDLPASFVASLNGESYEIIKDVQGYVCKATQAKELLPTPQLSNVIYYSALQSDSKLDFIQIGVGRLKFNADQSLDPSLGIFTNYFLDNPVHDFSNSAQDGVQIVYRDATGNIWISDEDDNAANNLEFITLKQESDEKGDYMKFTAKFNVILKLDVDSTHPDFGETLVISNATFQGYFKR
ncbi:MAG TPA: hypothetical protein VL021_08105 [Brumimicrobium sp.]|nr:hypothetical protein [Brumimicrobium sp.]